MSISSEINRITNARDDIGDAIEEMGVTVPSGTQIDGMASLIRSGITGHIQDTNNPHQVTAAQTGAASKTAGIYYTTCTTAGETQQKDITISDITSLNAGLQIRIRFSYQQAYNGTPTLKLNSFAAKEIRRDVNNAAGQYEWRGTETLDLVYDGTYWIIVDGSAASVTYYGVTKLNNAVDSSSEVLAASSKAVKTVNDSLTSHTGNTSNPHSVTATQVGLGNVDNVKQYSTSNPPPYPVTSVNGSTGAVTVTVPDAYTSNPAMDGTASPGSSTKWAKGDHVHPTDTSRAPAGYGLGVQLNTVTAITDANDATVTGWFCTTASTSNLPSNRYTTSAGVLSAVVRGTYVYQVYYDYDNHQTFGN